MAKDIGGTNGMHMSSGKHPFGITTKAHAPMPKMAKTVGVGSNPGGEGNLQSANSSMKKKSGPLSGPGKA